GVSNAVINIVLLICGFKIVGKSFTVKTLVCVAVLSVMMDIASYLPPLTNDIFLATIFGATLYGFGIGLALANGASSGGTDILSRILQAIFPHMPIGKLIMIVDAAVIATSLVVFRQIDVTLYGIVALFVSTFAIDKLIQMLNISKIAFIMTNKGEMIAKKLVHTSPRGVTIVNVVGAYTMREKHMLMCALKQREVVEFQKKVLEIDKDAFIIFSESSQIVGNGFYVYK
ncbi:MAG: YitT family protein, partial [Clostridia bacterium]|nr:YitT family protein [Clostridia bacterium]